MNLFNNKKEKSLSNQFAIMTNLVIFITIIFMAAYYIFVANKLVEISQAEQAVYNNSLSNIIFDAAKNSIKNDDYTEIKKVTQNLILNDLVAYVNVFNKDTNNYEWSSNENTYLNERENNTNQVFGAFDNYKITVGFTNQPLMLNYIKGMIQNNKLLAILFIFLGVLSSFLMAKSITKPLKQLTEGTEELSKGNLKYEIKKTEYQEINKLVDAFNDMAQKLDNLYTSLEQKVKDRTAEISTKNEELQSANKKIKETQSIMVHSEKMRSLGELVAGITHEINNPVNFIYGNLIHLKNYSADLIKIIDKYEANEDSLSESEKEEINALKEKIDYNFLKTDLPELLRSCTDGAERTKKIIIDLKSFSRLDNISINEIDVHKEIETTLNILHNKYKNKIEVIKEYGNIPEIESIGGQLNQVFMNILDNASYAIKDKGNVYIRTKIDEENENYIIIEVEDNGVGIDKDNLSKVCEPFFTTKPVGQGTGLGMSISYKVIKNHNGNIEIKSNKDKGTKVIIKLPIRGLNIDELAG